MQKETKSKVFNPVLDFILSKVETVDMVLLRYLAGFLPYEIQERFVYAIAGIYNPIAMASALSVKSHPYQNNSDSDYSDATLLGYDFLNDKVFFKVKKTQYSTFKNEELAKRFTETGKRGYDDVKWARNPTEEYPFLGTYVDENYEGTCSYSDWIKNAVVEEKGE